MKGWCFKAFKIASTPTPRTVRRNLIPAARVLFCGAIYSRSVAQSITRGSELICHNPMGFRHASCILPCTKPWIIYEAADVERGSRMVKREIRSLSRVHGWAGHVNIEQFNHSHLRHVCLLSLCDKNHDISRKGSKPVCESFSSVFVPLYASYHMYDIPRSRHL
jgi:hypothetical protein